VVTGGKAEQWVAKQSQTPLFETCGLWLTPASPGFL
jgi:hypothetical protein